MESKKATAELIDHIGWDLWRASAAWKRRFSEAMVAKGHAWYGEARGNLIQYIGRDGIQQNDIVRRAGVTKQAVQQHLDELVRDGVIERAPDPEDARRKLVRFTEEGMQALSDANIIKRAIEKDFEQIVGKEDAQVLKRALAKIIAED